MKKTRVQKQSMTKPIFHTTEYFDSKINCFMSRLNSFFLLVSIGIFKTFACLDPHNFLILNKFSLFKITTKRKLTKLIIIMLLPGGATNAKFSLVGEGQEPRSQELTISGQPML